jgi:hypothetical protein
MADRKGKVHLWEEKICQVYPDVWILK